MNPHEPVTGSFSNKIEPSRAHLLDSPGKIGRTFNILFMKSIQKACAQRVIVVAESAVTASLLEGERTSHSLQKILVSRFSETSCSKSMDSKLGSAIHRVNLII